MCENLDIDLNEGSLQSLALLAAYHMETLVPYDCIDFSSSKSYEDLANHVGVAMLDFQKTYSKYKTIDDCLKNNVDECSYELYEENKENLDYAVGYAMLNSIILNCITQAIKNDKNKLG